MSGYRSKFFRHDCESQGCYCDQLPCWDDLIEAFPRRIRPTDVDGMVEINGHVLFLEEKRAGKGLEEGQRRALAALSSRPDITTVFFRPLGGDLEVLIYGEGPPKGWQRRSRDWFVWWLSAWADHADSSTAAAA